MNRFIAAEKKWLVIMTLILGLTAWGGCTKQEKVLPDFELYKGGTTSFEKAKYQEARKFFQDIEVLYPESRFLSGQSGDCQYLL